MAEGILNPRIASKGFEIQRFISHQVSSVANQIFVVQQKLTPDHVLLPVSICSFTSLCPRFIGCHGNASFYGQIENIMELPWQPISERIICSYSIFRIDKVANGETFMQTIEKGLKFVLADLETQVKFTTYAKIQLPNISADCYG